MEFVEWANGKGYSISISREDAAKLIELLKGSVERVEIDECIYECEIERR